MKDPPAQSKADDSDANFSVSHFAILSISLTAEPTRNQIQALDGTRPGLPIKPGQCGTMTRESKRDGATTGFAEKRGRAFSHIEFESRHSVFAHTRRLDPADERSTWGSASLRRTARRQTAATWRVAAEPDPNNHVAISIR
jgi:hypothetical protein